ncbi:LPXTG-motif_cell wall anchor domain [Hexamita inflata]|uniref:LPXTG-motif cell wall anchor domain n=1 Tax=Hexamita inflata TaxID=28002 RepID=A0AA86NIS4_9EUKA|nr:LPXTG-motif cell wall anchor domain [Hexamita inflata]
MNCLLVTIQQQIYITGYNNIYNAVNYIDSVYRSFSPLKFCFGNFVSYDIPLNINEIRYSNQFLQIYSLNQTYVFNQPLSCEIYSGPFETLNDVQLFTIFQNISVKSFSRDLYNQILVSQQGLVYVYGHINDQIINNRYSDVLCVTQLNISIIPASETIVQVGTLQNVSYIVTEQNLYYIGDCTTTHGICGYDENNLLILGQVQKLTKFNLPSQIVKIHYVYFHLNGILIQDQDLQYYYAGQYPQYHCVNNPSNSFLHEFKQIFGSYKNISIGDLNAVLVTESGELQYCGQYIQNDISTYYSSPTSLTFEGQINQVCAMLTGVVVLNNTGLYASGMNQFGSLGLGVKRFYTNGFVLVNQSFGNMNMLCFEDRIILYEPYNIVKQININKVLVSTVVSGLYVLFGAINAIICCVNGKKLVNQRVKSLKRHTQIKAQLLRENISLNKERINLNIEELIQRSYIWKPIEQKTISIESNKSNDYNEMNFDCL